jgi:hypothetical protein
VDEIEGKTVEIVYQDKHGVPSRIRLWKTPRIRWHFPEANANQSSKETLAQMVAHMAFSKTRVLTLSVSLLLASTSLASAGFIWLSPDQPALAPETAYTPQAESPLVEQGAQPEGREWKAEEAAPAAPLALGAAPQMSQATLAPGASAVLSNETVSGSPVYSQGDQASSAPAAVPAAPAVTAAAPAPASASSGEVTLGRMRSEDVPAAPSALSPETKPVELSPVAANAAPAPEVSQSAISLVTGEEVRTTSPVAPPAPAPEMQSAKPVEGFGKHVPLIIALRQILPSDYGFAHRDGVDLTQSVDWQGGRPWPQVLSEAIAPIGLKATITADTVLLEKAGASSAPAPAAAAVSAPAAPVAMAPELTPPASAHTSSGPAQLTNATIMQAPPAND